MLVALYSDHHRLPFWPGSKPLPEEMFDPEVHGKRVFTFNAGTSTEEKQAVSDSWMWPVLMGLHQIDWPIMAHVSAFCECQGPGLWHFPKRVWIQISTLPSEKTQEGIPLTVGPKKTADEEPKVLVQHLWGGDNGTRSPYDFVIPQGEREPPPESNQPEFWRDFFMTELRQVKSKTAERLTAALAAATANAELYDNIPS